MPSPLAAPLPLPCGAVLPNRLAKSAMSENLAGPDHAPDARLERLYTRWGGGGAGLLLTGNVMVDRTALGEPHNVVVEDERPLDALRRWAAASQASGTPTWVQLNHPGRQSPATLSKVPVAPSAVPLRLPAFRPPRALAEAEIEGLVGRFARAAGVCRRAGFSGVQVHGAHGYLVSQFLSPLANVRTDGWGGDATRRRRFLVEVVRAIRAEVGPGFPVGVKLNSADFQRGGFSEEESMEVVEVLEAEGVDLLEISGGTYEKPQMTGVPQRSSTVAREAYFLEYAAKVRGRTKLPLWLTGGFRTRAGMEAALNSGAVDVIGLARPLVLDPEAPRRLLDGSSEGCPVAPRRTGVRPLDALLEVSWYTWQLHRIAAGKEPDPGVWPWTVLAGMAWDTVTGR